MLQESWMVGEIVVLAMFENEDALFVEKIAIEYEVWNLGELLQCVWRIGKDEIELLLAGSQEAEYIAANQKIPVFAQFLETLADEVGMVAVGLYADYSAASTGYQFQRDAACAGKEVEGSGILEIDVICKTLKMFSFAKSVVGRALNERGMSKWRPLYCPVMILIINFLTI